MLPGPSCRGRESPLGFEPVVPVGAKRLAPPQPEVVSMNGYLLRGGTLVLSPRAEGRRDATFLDPQRLGLASWRGRRRFALAGWGRCLGGLLPAGLALGLDPQRLGLASWRGRWRFALAGWGRCQGGPLPAGLAFGLDPQRLGLASWRGRRRFALAGWGRCLGGPLPAGLALGHAQSLDTWSPRAGPRLRE